MHRRPPLQRRRNKICWRVVTSILSNCSEMFFLARIGRPDILWSVWINLHDWLRNGSKRVTNAWIDWFHAFITHVNANRISLWITLQNNADWDHFKTPILREILRIQDRLLKEHCAFFGSHKFVPTSWMCKKTNFSFTQLKRVRNHFFGRWIEISRDSFSRFMGSDCFFPWKHDSDSWKTGENRSQRWQRSQIKQIFQGMTNVLNHIDSVPSNVQFSSQEALLYVFEDNEAVIKMIIKGRGPTLRHVSRTDKVALDWLLDRINLDPKIQIKYIDTKKPTCRYSNQKGISHVMSGIICWICLSSVISALQLAPLQWQDELNKDQEKNVSQPNRDLWWIWPRGCLRSCLLQLHQIRGGPRMDIKILEICRGRRSIGETWETVTTRYSKKDYGQSWSSQEWKSGAAEHDRSGTPEKTSWDMMQKVALHREEPLLHGNAHSVRYGETIHDVSGKPAKFNYQEKADSETFVVQLKQHLLFER